MVEEKRPSSAKLDACCHLQQTRCMSTPLGQESLAMLISYVKWKHACTADMQRKQYSGTLNLGANVVSVAHFRSTFRAGLLCIVSKVAGGC